VNLGFQPIRKICTIRHYRVKYLFGESDSGLFGGNSNLRAPFWVPANYLLILNMRRWSLTTCAASPGKLGSSRSMPESSKRFCIWY